MEENLMVSNMILEMGNTMTGLREQSCATICAYHPCMHSPMSVDKPSSNMEYADTSGVQIP